MLEIIDLAKRYGPVVALDGATFTARPGRSSDSSDRMAPARPRRCAASSAWRPIAARSAGPAARRPRQRLRFGYMPEQRGLYPRMRVAEQLSYFAQQHGLGGKAANAAAPLAGADGPRRPGQVEARGAVARQPRGGPRRSARPPRRRPDAVVASPALDGGACPGGASGRPRGTRGRGRGHVGARSRRRSRSRHATRRPDGTRQAGCGTDAGRRTSVSSRHTESAPPDTHTRIRCPGSNRSFAAPFASRARSRGRSPAAGVSWPTRRRGRSSGRARRSRRAAGGSRASPTRG